MKKVLLYGLGRSNLALYKLMLLDENLDLFVTCEDMNFPDVIQSKHQIDVNKVCFSDYKEIYVPPGISEKHDIYSQCDPMNEIDYAFTKLDAKFIGITGSNGKSTTCKLLSDSLNFLGKPCCIGGNYGVPLSDIVLERKAYEYVVIELSSFQLRVLQEIQFEAVVITNIEPNHLDWHKDMESYQSSKLSILQMMAESGKAIISDRKVSDSFRVPHLFSEDLVLDFVPQNSDLKIQWLNAFAVLRHLGLNTKSLKDFKFVSLEHRLQHLSSKSGIICINDSKSTTPGSTIFALESLGYTKIVLILGGKSKGLDLKSFVEELSTFTDKLESIYIYGDLQQDLELFNSLGIEIFSTLNFMDLLNGLKAKVMRGHTILLSPAFSSLDQFKSFEERGLEFMKFIETI